jgi:hypothetical protein
MARKGRGRGADGVHIEGLDEFIAELRQLKGDTNWVKAFTKAERKIGNEIAAKARAAAPAASRQAGHFASAIKGGATAGQGARISLGGATTASGKTRAAPGFWGRKSQGNWIGTSWDVGEGGGPYAINSTIAAETSRITQAYGDAIEELSKQAFND